MDKDIQIMNSCSKWSTYMDTYVVGTYKSLKNHDSKQIWQ